MRVVKLVNGYQIHPAHVRTMSELKVLNMITEKHYSTTIPGSSGGISGRCVFHSFLYFFR